MIDRTNPPTNPVSSAPCPFIFISFSLRNKSLLERGNLASSQLTTQNQLNYYSRQIEAHAKAIVKLNKVLDKLDRALSQRKLNEYR